ncbi:MAG: DNA polymerase III subunit gamma/tau [Solirubrobacteraceae bacterium]|nr:DNA polymerase III subunit gamma/tau [Solirubrobacteraceae bacterium]
MSEVPSLYRRHRPRTFADVVGQDHVVRTLRNAVSQDKVHHAYLFVGSRGTGKTSMAKILAACLNCEQGPTIEPCGACDSCVSIAAANSLDVIEMDAASNNSVDDIRDLRESVVYAPVSGRHKVYILDEAHMLSTQAWNAFLKTLEEPPPNTVFVLATTEASKVLPTVVDRCHRFDFGRPTVEQLAAVVKRVADAERIAIAPDAIVLLARHATGSFRDALGTLEQLVTYAGEDPAGDSAALRIATEDVLAVLGVADADLLFAAFDAIAAGDARAALLAAAELTQSGRDALGFVRDLEAHARDLMIVQMLGHVPPELQITPDRDARLQEQSGRVGTGAVARLLDLLAAALEATKNGSDARTQLELALVKASAPAVDPSTQALLQRVERLEAALRGVSSVAPIQPTPAPAAEPVAPEPQSEPDPGPAAEPVAAEPRSEPAPGPAAEPVAAEPQSEPAPGPAAEPRSEQPAGPAPAAAAEPRSEPAPAPGPEAAAPAAAPHPPSPAVAVAAPIALDVEQLRAVWPAVLEQVKSAGNVLCAAALAETRPIAVDDGRLTVAFAHDAAYLLRRVEDAEYRACVTDAIHAVTGARTQIAYVLDDAAADVAAPAAAPPTESEWLERFVAEFDAEEIHPESEAS